MQANYSVSVQAIPPGLNTTAIDKLKDLVGLGGLSHLDDVAVLVSLRSKTLVRELLNEFGDQSRATCGNSRTYFRPRFCLFKFCDALEVKDGVSSPTSGWGLEHALLAWGNYSKMVYLPNSECDVFPVVTSRHLLMKPPRCFGY